MTKLFPIPKLDNKVFDTTRKWEAMGEHRRLYTFSDKDYQNIAQIWKGVHPIDGGKLEAYAGLPGHSGSIPDLPDLPEEFAPGISAEDLLLIASRLKREAGL